MLKLNNRDSIADDCNLKEPEERTEMPQLITRAAA